GGNARGSTRTFGGDPGFLHQILSCRQLPGLLCPDHRKTKSQHRSENIAERCPERTRYIRVSTYEKIPARLHPLPVLGECVVADHLYAVPDHSADRAARPAYGRIVAIC